MPTSRLPRPLTGIILLAGFAAALTAWRNTMLASNERRLADKRP